jgi:hypothetical protein
VDWIVTVVRLLGQAGRYIADGLVPGKPSCSTPRTDAQAEHTQTHALVASYQVFSQLVCLQGRLAEMQTQTGKHTKDVVPGTRKTRPVCLRHQGVSGSLATMQLPDVANQLLAQLASPASPASQPANQPRQVRVFERWSLAACRSHGRDQERGPRGGNWERGGKICSPRSWMRGSVSPGWAELVVIPSVG